MNLAKHMTSLCVGCTNPATSINNCYRLLVNRTGSFNKTSVRFYSATRTTVPLEDIFSKKNLERCQEKSLSVKPVREVGWMHGNKKMTEAAVLVPLCTVQGEPSVLFTLRTKHLGSHKGEVSFPGGKRDAGETLVEAAVREAEEEVGLAGERVAVWGHMLPVPGKDFRMAVTPVLGYCGEVELSDLHPSLQEVEEIFHVPIQILLQPENQRYTRWNGNFKYVLPVFLGAKHRIWGLSAIILHQAMSLLLPGTYNFKLPTVKR